MSFTAMEAVMLGVATIDDASRNNMIPRAFAGAMISTACEVVRAALGSTTI